MGAQMCGILTTAGEPPGAGDLIAAIDRDCFIRARWPPCEYTVRRPEDFLRHVRLQIRAGSGTAVTLTHHPSRRTICRRDRLRYLGEYGRFQLHPTDRPRFQ